MSVLFIFLLSVFTVYIFVAGQSYEFYSKFNPSVSVVKNLLLSLAWPGNAVMFLLMRCLR